MFKRRLTRSLLLLMLLLPGASALAEPHNIMATGQARAGRNQTAEDVHMQARLAAIATLYKELEAFIESRPQLRDGLKPEYRLPFALRAFSVDPFSDKQELVNGVPVAEVRIKAWIDTDLLPEDLPAYLEKNKYILQSMGQHVAYIRQLQARSDDFMRRLSQTGDPGELVRLRQGEGLVLGRQYRALGMAIQAYNAFERERFDEALKFFNQALSEDPDYANAYFGRGIVNFQKESFDAALADFSKAIKLDAKAPMYFYLRGVTYFLQGVLPDKAIEDMNATIALQPENADAYYLRGGAYANKNACAPANRDFEKACQLGLNQACSKQCSRDLSND